MNKTLLTFGAGPNTCIGKNIALLELYKAVPSILRAFKASSYALRSIHRQNIFADRVLQLELANPEKPWKIFNLGDPEPYEFFVRLKRRY